LHMEALILIQVVLSLVVFSALIKLSAHVYKRTRLAWKHAFVFCFISIAITAFGKLLKLPELQWLPVSFVALLGLCTQATIAGWYLGRHATTNDGEPLLFRGGLMLWLVSLAVAIVLIAVLALVVAIFKLLVLPS
jgi:hypothetical protein